MKLTDDDWFILVTRTVVVIVLLWILLLVLTSCSVRVFSPGNDDTIRRYLTIENKE